MTCDCGAPARSRWCEKCESRNRASVDALLAACQKQHRGAGGAAICICGASCGGSAACAGLWLLRRAIEGDQSLRNDIASLFGWDKSQ